MLLLECLQLVLLQSVLLLHVFSQDLLGYAGGLVSRLGNGPYEACHGLSWRLVGETK